MSMHKVAHLRFGYGRATKAQSIRQEGNRSDGSTQTAEKSEQKRPLKKVSAYYFVCGDL